MSRAGVVAGLLTLVAVCAPAAAEADCKLVEIGDFQLDPSSSVPVVDGAINGAPVKILLDTGVVESVVLRSAAVQLGVSMTPHAYSEDNASFQGLIGQLRIGSVARSNVELNVTDELAAPPGVSLVLGDDFLSKADVEFDLAHNAVRMFQPEGCTPPQLIYWGAAYSQATLAPWDQDAPTTRAEVQVNARPVLASFDSGAAASSIDADAAQALGAQPAGAPRPGGQAGWVGQFASFALGDERVNSVRLLVLPQAEGYGLTSATLRRGPHGAPVMRIGADFLRAHRVFFDMKDRLVLLSYAGGPVFAPDAAAR
jgi:predicted aspartyl protease